MKTTEDDAAFAFPPLSLFLTVDGRVTSHQRMLIQ